MMRQTAGTLAVYHRGLDAYLAQWARRRYRVPALLRELIRTLSPGARVLDVGCGPGQDTRYLAARGFRPGGVDAVGPFLQWARAQRRKTPLVQGDLLALPFRPNSFDAAWAAASLIHLSKRDVRRALRDLRAIIAPGGRLAATFVHGTASGVSARGWLPGRYFSRWTKSELETAVANSGWHIETIATVTNRERKGRWLNLVAGRSQGRGLRR